jgi:CheY-like chemotaxis protein
MLPYYHPSSIVIIDDDALFLETIKFSLSDSFPCETFTDPKRAIQVLKERQSTVRNLEHFVVPSESTPDVPTHQLGDQFVQVRTSGVTALVKDAERFSQISVAVIDFDMPGINGLQICRQLADLPMRKILLTGKATTDIAIRAFNERIIDCYIAKQDSTLATRLKTEIRALEAAYFKRIAEPLASVLGLEATRFIADPACEELFAAERHARNVVEHYVMAEPPGILMVSATGEITVLVVYSDQDMAAHAEVAMAEDAPVDLIRALAARLVVPTFPTPSGMYEKSLEESWRNHVWPARQLQGRERWYHASVTDKATAALVPRGLVSYASHRASAQSTRH